MYTTCLVDGNAVAHTILLKECKDEQTFVRKYFSRLRDYSNSFTSLPKFILFFDDKQGGTWRDNLYPSYQEGRKTQKAKFTQEQLDDDIRLSSYVRYLKSVIDNSNKFKYIEYPHTEADDLISLYCNNIQQDDETVTIFTTDKDLFQLINNSSVKRVQVFFLVKRQIIKDTKEGEEALITKLWLGDNSDSIPGVCKNVGEKSIEDLKTFIKFAKSESFDYKDVAISKEKCKTANIKYVPSFSNFSYEQYLLNKKLIDLQYVVELDKKDNNIKTQYIIDNLKYCKVSPFALYGLTTRS